MDRIFFPANYKKALLSGRKNMTIRFGGELGKYKKGRTYAAFSYAGKDWKIRVRIESVSETSFSQLEELKIMKSSILRIANEQGRRDEDFSLEIIRFKII